MDSRQEHSLEGEKAERRAVIVVGVVCFRTGGWERPVEVVRHKQLEGTNHTEICKEDPGRGNSKGSNSGDSIPQTGWLINHKVGVSWESIIYSSHGNLSCPVWYHSCIYGYECISQY